MENRLNLGVIFGGVSSEYEISLLSATSVLKNIDREKYHIYTIGITKDGRMFNFTGDINDIKSDNWHEYNCAPCVVSPDRSHHGLIMLSDPIEIISLDCIFPILHGKNGEDGTFQGLLEIASIPYVGCDTLSCASCMDKTVTKTILDSVKIPNSKSISIRSQSYFAKKPVHLYEIESSLGYPCFVKPANAGSSVGVSKATDRQTLEAALLLAFKHDKKAIIEEMITGMEIECAVLGNNDPIASVLGEIVPCNEFYDYEAKYLDDGTKTYVPARIDPESARKITATAISAYKAMGCSGLARIDFFLQPDGKVILNELNTIPGFTSISMYPQLFAESGVPFKELIDRLISLALEKSSAQKGAN